MHRECIRLWHANRARHLSFNVLVSKGHEWSNFRLHIFLFSSFFSFVWTNESRKGRGKVSIDANCISIESVVESRGLKKICSKHKYTLFFESSSCKLWQNFEMSLHLSLLTIFTEIIGSFQNRRIDQWPASEAPFRPVHLYYANCAGTATRSKFQSKGFRGDPSPHCTGSCAPWGLLAPCNFTLASVHARFAYSGVYWNTSGDRA